jgi:hypothetical protein
MEAVMTDVLVALAGGFVGGILSYMAVAAISYYLIRIERRL